MEPLSVFNVGTVELGRELVFIAGPCVIEDRDSTLRVAERLADLAMERGCGLIFKSSYDKANRTGGESFRGPGLEEGLRVLVEVREAIGLPVLTDVHSPEEARAAGEVVDCLQVPAFLCRQTDLVTACALTGKPVNVKKGQFLAPDDTRHIVAKLTSAGCDRIILTERGYAFGYHDLVVDLRSLAVMREIGALVCYDATHSLQQPGGASGQTGGLRAFVPPLARAAAAFGVDALFAETHPDPPRAKSDPATVWPLNSFGRLMDQILAVDGLRRELGKLGPDV
ncbi:MAG TPA: 3-deoxy-8-phosphooctulonate synthase [bacterium]|nr:3-deoxy-8-phosphooctulonate synthase [bacterium]